MAAITKIRAADGALLRAEQVSRTPSRRVPGAAAGARASGPAASPAQAGGGKTRLGVPAAMLAHGTSDRFRIRLVGRQAETLLQLAAAEIAWHPDVFRIRIARASASLILWVRLGSDLEGDGANVVELVSEALRRIALGERSSAAPIESGHDAPLSRGLAFLKAVAL
jgi:hypothetical protein